jgi:hypothetical protein
MSPIPVLEERIHMDGGANIVHGTKICRSGYFVAHAFDDVVGEGRTIFEGTRGGREHA